MESWSPYHLAVIAALLISIGTWITGNFLGARNIVRYGVRGMIGVLAVAALVWVALGMAPVPEWIISGITDVLGR